jgi:hypothetical protein
LFLLNANEICLETLLVSQEQNTTTPLNELLDATTIVGQKKMKKSFKGACPNRQPVKNQSHAMVFQTNLVIPAEADSR